MYIKQQDINREREEREVNTIIKREGKSMKTMPIKLRADNKNETNSIDETYRFNTLDRKHGPMAGTGPRPIIFQKKKTLNNIKPLKLVANDTGKTRHYPPGAQE